MTTFTDNLLVQLLDAGDGYASEKVRVMDPALGTGTYLLGVLDRIKDQVTERTGEGAVSAAMSEAAADRLIGFEIQSCPYAVAQLRLAEHLQSRSDDKQRDNLPALRVFLADTLDSPLIDVPEMPLQFEELTKSRAEANRIKREEPIVVVIGNPPFPTRISCYGPRCCHCDTVGGARGGPLGVLTRVCGHVGHQGVRGDRGDLHGASLHAGARSPTLLL